MKKYTPEFERWCRMRERKWRHKTVDSNRQDKVVRPMHCPFSRKTPRAAFWAANLFLKKERGGDRWCKTWTRSQSRCAKRLATNEWTIEVTTKWNERSDGMSREHREQIEIINSHIANVLASRDAEGRCGAFLANKYGKVCGGNAWSAFPWCNTRKSCESHKEITQKSQGNHTGVTRKSRESHKEVMRTRYVQDVSYCESWGDDARKSQGNHGDVFMTGRAFQ